MHLSPLLINTCTSLVPRLFGEPGHEATYSPWFHAVLPICLAQDSNHLYLVMDFHPGGDLLSVMERNEGGMSEVDARSLQDYMYINYYKCVSDQQRFDLHCSRDYYDLHVCTTCTLSAVCILEYCYMYI